MLGVVSASSVAAKEYLSAFWGNQYPVVVLYALTNPQDTPW